MENVNLNLLFAKRRALVKEQEKLNENLKALREVISNDELGKDWKTFPAFRIERNNKLRDTCWNWEFRIMEIEREIRNLDKDIMAQKIIQQEKIRSDTFREIDDRLCLVVPEPKLRSYIRSLVGDLSFIQDDLLESIVVDPNLRKVLCDLKAIVTSIPKQSGKVSIYVYFKWGISLIPFFCMIFLENVWIFMRIFI